MQHNSFLWWLALITIYLIGIGWFKWANLIALNYLFYTNTGLNPDTATLWRSIKHTKPFIKNKNLVTGLVRLTVTGVFKAFLAAFFSVVLVALFVSYGWSLRYIFVFLYVNVLLLLAYIDRYTYILPDALILPLTILSIGHFTFVNGIYNIYIPIFGFLTGYFVLYILNFIGLLVYKKRGFGAGDLKLMAGIGVWAGAGAIPLILCIASITNVVFAIIEQRTLKPNGYYPFGPFIAIGAIVTLIYSKYVLI